MEGQANGVVVDDMWGVMEVGARRGAANAGYVQAATRVAGDPSL